MSRHLPIRIGRFLAAALVLFEVAPAAQARNIPSSLPVVIETAQPVKWQTRTIIDDRLFDCTGQRCVGRMDGVPANQHRTCRQFARKHGAVVAVVVAGRPFTADELERCNKR